MWKITFDNNTKRATGFNRDAVDGEFMVELEPSLCGWVYETPERYQYIDGEFTEVPTWPAELVVKERMAACSDKLNTIDTLVAMKQGALFEYNGNKFYPDADYIQATCARLGRLPDEAVISWKTADKAEDNVNNIEIKFTKPEFIAFADALYDNIAAVWYHGNELKKSIKMLTLDNNAELSDIKGFVVSLDEPVEMLTESVSG